MGLYTELPVRHSPLITIVDTTHLLTFGKGGCAGCIIASRLSDADATLSILVIESGKNNYELPIVTHLGFWFTHLAPGNDYTRILQGPKSKQLSGRQAAVPIGHILGGGTSINMAMYSRAVRSDLDSWKAPGWSADELLPYMKKFETYHGPGPRDRHGYDGPIQVSGTSFRAPKLENDFINALGELGWPEIEDINTLDNINGVMRAVRYVDPKGRRQDVAHMYLHPRLQDGKHPNLHVLVESQVERVLFEGQKVSGVVYRPNPAFQPKTTPSQENSRVVKARRMVIISAGSLGTPQLLERSGVGDLQILKKAGVPVVAEVPGVGHNYDDHNSMMYPYYSDIPPEESMDGLNSGRVKPEELIARGDGILGWNSVDAQAKLRPTDADVASLGPEFQEAWNREFANVPNKPFMIMSPVSGFPFDPSLAPIPGQYMSLVTFSLYPFSRGHIHITGPGIDDPVDFDPGLLTDAQNLDIKNQIWAYKKQREIARRMGVCRGEVSAFHPTFPPGSKARIETGTETLEYSEEDDRIIEQFIHDHVDSTWHPIGTCKLAPREKLGVVDSALSVYGVQGLKIADMSIPPHNIGANLANTAMMIGEKAADIFIQELGLGEK
ncbi:putative alcohol oxidase [Hypoxylon trugodes]|uniref:putative alcohol oxidase n=1 Tax=Hypoxylon trugodes TaxID=326681 RepID=UPI0021915305|nr:putative alcohol oxidase [Hypoxylon trugodes]KAI1390620.1 putative alcohol oxidase [Hypoxylon trugodes]